MSQPNGYMLDLAQSGWQHPANRGSSSTTVNCHGCGAPIIWAEYQGEKIPLDSAESFSGPHRYSIVEYGQVWKVEKTHHATTVPGHTDHRAFCPAR